MSTVDVEAARVVIEGGKRSCASCRASFGADEEHLFSGPEISEAFRRLFRLDGDGASLLSAVWNGWMMTASKCRIETAFKMGKEGEGWKT